MLKIIYNFIYVLYKIIIIYKIIYNFYHIKAIINQLLFNIVK